MDETIKNLAKSARSIDNPEGVPWDSIKSQHKQMWLDLAKAFYSAASKLDLLK